MTYDFQTSYSAYKEPGKDRCREIVLQAIKQLGVCNDKQIAEYLKWPINRVTPRRGELETAGKIEGAGKGKNSEGRMVNWWRVKIEVKQGEMFV